MTEGASELTGLLKEIQIEVGHGDVLLCGLHSLHLSLSGLLKAILKFLGLATNLVYLIVGVCLENFLGAPKEEQDRVSQRDIFFDLLLA